MFTKGRSLISILVGILLLGGLSYQLREQWDGVYEVPPPPSMKSPLHFEEVSAKMGIHFKHRYFFPHWGMERNGNIQILGTMFPAVAVADVDGDGFMDLYFSAARTGVPNEFYHNQGGKGFVEMAGALGIADVNAHDPSTYSVFADFNRDGNLDLLVAKWGCHKLFEGQGSGKPFREVTEKLGGYCSNPNGMAVGDMDRDGNLDLVFGNFRPDVNLEWNHPEMWVVGVRGDKRNGGKSHILYGKADGSFDPKEKYEFSDAPFTHSVGLTDLDGDGYPDLLFANDHSESALFANRGGHRFEEITNKMFPQNTLGNTSMDAEIFDFNQDGLQDIFITEGFKPPYRFVGNELYVRKADGTFASEAWPRHVAKCGFAWGGKFADFDLDGEPDLFVVNGRVRSYDAQDPETSSSFWYEHLQVGFVPNPLRNIYKRQTKSTGQHGFDMSGFERSCMFWQKDGQFFDVAEQAGIDDLENGRGLALVDYDNDGLMDIVVTNVGGPALLYHNISDRQGDWLGFDLDGGLGHRIPFGARLEVERDGPHKILRELYPTNGMKAQSDPRILIGLGKNAVVGAAIVTWPDGVQERFVKFLVNHYNRLIRGKGEKIERS